MGNMSYCRFENTLADLRDCERQLIDEGCLTSLDEYGDKISKVEFQKALRLIELCKHIADYFDGDLSEIEKEYNELKED